MICYMSSCFQNKEVVKTNKGINNNLTKREFVKNKHFLFIVSIALAVM